jgi:glutamate--cysteine ligase
MVTINSARMKSRGRLNADGFDESIFLVPLEEAVTRGSTLAEVMPTEYHSAWAGCLEPVSMEHAY